MLKKKRYTKYSQDSSFPYIRIILILMLAVGLALLYVWQRVSVIKYAQAIDSLKTQLSERKEEYKYLSFEVAQLSSAENIQKTAQSKLGMLLTSNQQVSFVLEPQKPAKPTSFLAKIKNTAKKIINVSENKVEAKEVKHDL
jgi:cell division protein FtsL